MKRRLYFLLPDKAHVERVVAELRAAFVPRSDMHILAREGTDLRGLPEVTRQQRRDWLHRLERLFWRGDVLLFVTALSGALIALLMGWPLWTFAMALLVILAFLAAWLEIRLPAVSLHGFREALSHGELLMMIDVPPGRLAEVANRVHRRHPEAKAAGVSYIVDTLGM
jgi:hypothetical protein